ncbi:SIMPL domain-containing protein [Youhaiella tibetensis]|uniref:SIMPL domain-containing protein n=2 Tax=Paradevosia tibetensis TaxID=1447062 RepID=A0A5B9DRV4_9HYPH|nr:SIMPL domain-containing protein [Youhaiella tibetensis]
MERPMRPITALVPFALATALTAPAFAQEAPRPGTISIEGRAEVTAAPDTAFVTSGVTTQGETAREALDANTKAMADLIAALKASNIEAKDIQTSGFSVNPNYVYSDERDANGYSKPPKIAGYQVSNAVTVRVRDLPSLGQVLDKAVTVGANTINGVSFSVADPSKLYDEARKAAFVDAKEKADLYAGVAGVSLERILSISENQNFSQPPQPYMMKSAMADASGAVPVQAGEMSFSVNVSVQWELAEGK